MDQRSLRVGICAILCGILFRLLSMTPAVRPDSQPESGDDAPVFRYIFPGESPVPLFPQAGVPPITEEEAAQLEIKYLGKLRVEPAPAALSEQRLILPEEGPAVLIYHTHTTESYTPVGEEYTESAQFRTLDAEYNMVAMGKYLADCLNAAGIPAVQDTAVHDHPSYNGAYTRSRKTMAACLAQYPGLQLLIDLHRDAIEEEPGVQLRTEATVHGQTAAQLMVVVGTDESGLHHPDWEKNLSFGLKLTALLERNSPGITRPLQLRSARFNQDMGPCALLVEVGAAGNTRQEALLAAQVLAQGIVDLFKMES